MIRIYHRIKHSYVLGKGKRYILYLQGCNHRCDGCIVKDSWNLEKGELVSINFLVNEINSSNVDGITISGGEPLLQYKGLLKLLSKIDKKLNIILYTGFLFEEVEMYYKEILKYVDLLIDGKYQKELDVGEPLIGSLNQRVFILSNRGEELFEYMKHKTKREVEFDIKNSEVFLVGIPDKKLLKGELL